VSLLAWSFSCIALSACIFFSSISSLPSRSSTELEAGMNDQDRTGSPAHGAPRGLV
jgi:hypothetical protein